MPRCRPCPQWSSNSLRWPPGHGASSGTARIPHAACRWSAPCATPGSRARGRWTGRRCEQRRRRCDGRTRT
eukprot:2568981-Pleurochrysis_carterae.AAC.1